MNAIRFETTVDEKTEAAMPKLRPMLGRGVEVIALESEAAPPNRTSFDDFLAARLKRPAGVAPITFVDMEKATGAPLSRRCND